MKPITRRSLSPNDALRFIANEAAGQAFTTLGLATNTAHAAAVIAIGDKDYETSPAINGLKSLTDRLHTAIESLRDFNPQNNLGVLHQKLQDTGTELYTITGKDAVLGDPALLTLAGESPDFDRAITMLAKAGKDARDVLFKLSRGSVVQSASCHAMA